VLISAVSATMVTEQAGVHSKAVMQNPSSYEVINPADFGVDRKIELAHRLTGWNALSARAKELNLNISDTQIKIATGIIKNMADEETVSLVQLDHVLMTLANVPQLPDPELLSAETDDSLSESAALAKAAIARFMVAAAQHAVDTMPNRILDPVTTRVIRVDGHLFDTAIVNRIMDICVDSQIDFKVLSLDIPNNNAAPSTTRIRFAASDETKLQAVFDSIIELAGSTRFELANATVYWDTDGVPQMENS
jgi:homocitrate synthase